MEMLTNILEGIKFKGMETYEALNEEFKCPDGRFKNYPMNLFKCNLCRDHDQCQFVQDKVNSLRGE